jgi:ligand-binding sensor domain-containing protein
MLKINQLNKIHWLLCILLWGFCPLVFAQKPLLNFKTVRGLSYVRCIWQSREGLMWFGSSNGLYSYDGYQIKSYKHNPADSTSLSDSDIMRIYEDKAGTLWIGTVNGGLNKFDAKTGTFKAYRFAKNKPNSLRANAVVAILEDGQGNFWIGTSGKTGGLSKMDREKGIFYNYQKPEIPFDFYALDLQTDKNGNIWIGTAGNGLLKFNPHLKTFKSFPFQSADSIKAFKNNVIRQVLLSQSGVIWTATYGGLNKFDLQNEVFTQHFENSPQDSSSLGNSSIWSIIETKDQKLWVSTFGGGLNLFNPLNGYSYRYLNESGSVNNLISNNLYRIFEDRAGGIWLGLADKAIQYFMPPNPNVVFYEFKQKIPFLRAQFIDSEGIYWFGSNQTGLYQYNPKNQKTIHFKAEPNNPTSLNFNNISAITQDSQGGIWVGTEGGGLHFLDKKTLTFTRFISKNPFKPNTNQLIHNAVEKIKPDRKGNFWIGTAAGFNYFDPREKNLFLILILP